MQQIVRCVTALAMLIGPFSASAQRRGTVRCSGNCLEPPLPICAKEPCIFVNEEEYAQNAVGLLLRTDTAAFRRIVEQAQARSKGLPLGKGIQDRQWFYDVVRVKSVTQELSLDPPMLAGSSQHQVLRTPKRYRNCGPQQSSRTVTQTVRSREEITKEVEETSTRLVIVERELNVGPSGKIVSASVRDKLTTELTNFRRNFLKRYIEDEFTNQVQDLISVPAYAIVERTTVVRQSIETYSAKGTVTTDATLYIPQIPGLEALGKWSDYVSARDRQIGVEVTTRLPVSDIEYILNTSSFKTETACKSAP